MTAAAPLATAARAAAGVAARRAAAATATPAATAVPAAAPGVAAAPSAPGVAPGSSGCTAASAWWAGTAGVASAPRAGTAGAVPAPPSRPPPLQPLLPVRPPVPLPSGCVLGFRGGTSAAATSITASAAAPRVVPLLPLRAGGAGTAGAVARWTAGGGATATGAARGGVVGGLPLTPHGGWRTLLTPPAGIRRPVGVPSTPAPWARSPSTSRGLESVLPRPKPPAAARARGGAAASGGAAAGGGGGGSGGSSVGRPGVWRRTPPPPRLPPGGRVRGVTALTASALGVAAAVTHEDRGAGLAILSAISDTSGPHTYGMGVLPPKGRVAVGAGLAAAAVAALGWLVWAATATAAPAVALGLLLAWATRPGAAELVGQMHAAAPAVARRKEGVVERVRVRVAPYLVRLQAMRVSDWGLFSVATVGDWVDYQYLYLAAMLFCPACANLLLLERSPSHHGHGGEDGSLRFFCRTCAYIHGVGGRRLTKSVSRLPRKVVDDVLGGEDAWALADKTETVCPKCGGHEAFFFQMQTRSADEPMSTFYRCVACQHQWKEN